MPSISTFSRDDPTHATSWIVNITLASRNEMYMTVQDCLASVRTSICANVEAAHNRVSFYDRRLHFLQQGMQSIDLGLVQIEIGSDVPSGNQKCVEFSDRESVSNGIPQSVFCHDRFIFSLAE